MNNHKIAKSSRLALVLCGLLLIPVLFTPIWRIDLTAPQYPEGLYLLIYADKLAGNVDIINGLNHYIGMKTLHTDDFIEFKVLPSIIIFFAALFILSAVIANKKIMNTAFILFVLFGIIAMADFWRWEYDYGHNLDPNAAIIVPGMAYQPPLIGFKQLLNFGAFSVPDVGGWLFIGSGLILLLTVIKEWRINRKRIQVASAMKLVLLCCTSVLMASCSTAPEPISLGKDNCDFCKMTISDPRFGAEIVTNKGKIYKFDDQHCILAFLKEDKLEEHDIAGVYFTDFNRPHELIHVESAHFLQSPALKSPMNGNIAAFRHPDSLANALPSFYGNAITWEDMQK